MRKLFLVAGLLLWPALGFAQVSAAPQVSAAVLSALLQENFQNLGQNVQKVLNLAMADEAKLAAVDAQIARQKAQLEWWAKTWPKGAR